MGMLTTLTIFNDELDYIENNPQQLLELVLNEDVDRNRVGVKQKPYHSDAKVVFIQMGNTCYNVNKEYDKRVLEELLEVLEYRVEIIKDRLRD